MTDKTEIFLSDFDGTLTTSDSMLRMLVFHRGRLWLYATLLLLSPLIALMFMHLMSNHHVKEILLHRAFGNMSKDELTTLCNRFAAANSDILRKELYDDLMAQHKVGHRVIVITASPRMWVQCFVPEFEVLGTELEFSAEDDVFTGRFATPNCYGPEKVNRLLKAYPDIAANRSAYYITAYGDSKGDSQMWDFADKAVIITH